MKILGIVGPIACGKGVVVEHLIKKYGYVSFSLSSLLHDELKKRGITTYTRTTLQDLGDELRKKEGDGVLAKRAIQQLKIQNLGLRIIIEGIRNPGEVAFLRSIPGFILIAVDAAQKVRFDRVIKREKPWDPKDWKSFLQVDGRDSADKGNMSGQHVRKCMSIADVHIKNNSDVEKVQKKVDRLFGNSKH